jgi:hypothetical protein
MGGFHTVFRSPMGNVPQRAGLTEPQRRPDRGELGSAAALNESVCAACMQ